MTRPNIIVIIADDLALEDQEVMTNTNALIGANGTTFTQFFAQHGICAPSRATFLTGQYPHNHGVLFNKLPDGGYTAMDHNETLPVWLKRAGYHTSICGKYLNGLGRDGDTDDYTQAPGWDDWCVFLRRRTYMMYDYALNENGTIIEPELYQTDWVAERAVSKIQEFGRGPQPYFMVLAPTCSHKESDLVDDTYARDFIRPAPRHQGVFANAEMPKTPAYNEEDVSDKPRAIRRLRQITAYDEEQIVRRWRMRREALLSLDELVADVYSAVQEYGYIENTIFIYWSDNGYQFGQHRIQDNKGEVYPESIRVPCMISGTPFLGGVTVDGVTANIDLAPTICALSGATATIPQDGIVLRPDGMEETKRRAILINAFKGINYAKGVRTPEWLWVDWGRGRDELYDLKNDPYRLENLVRDAAYNTVKQDMMALLDSLSNCEGAQCEVYMPEENIVDVFMDGVKEISSEHIYRMFKRDPSAVEQLRDLAEALAEAARAGAENE